VYFDTAHFILHTRIYTSHLYAFFGLSLTFCTNLTCWIRIWTKKARFWPRTWSRVNKIALLHVLQQFQDFWSVSKNI